MNITQLKAKVKAAQKANAAKIAEATTKATLEALLKLESSKELFNAKVRLSVNNANTNALTVMLNECIGIVDSVPVTNTKTHALREWNGSRRFAFGEQINLVYQLATGIMYSCTEHKALLLAHTGLNMEIINSLVSSFGSPAYYSRNYNTLVEAVPSDVEEAKSALAVIQSVLAVSIDTDALTEANVKTEFDKAKVTASMDKMKADEAIEEMELSLQ